LPQSVDERLAAKKAVRVCLRERLKALVRVGIKRRCPFAAGRLDADTAIRRNENSLILV
jgi:hypothetical protein